MVQFSFAEVLKDIRDLKIVPYDLEYNRTKDFGPNCYILYYFKLHLFKLKLTAFLKQIFVFKTT